ncbi:MAG: hypothetical protein BMS9Abin36_0965 [Gammaproteobacteria bacterium]|nr:MAG: hypothetical protein BMS9Abin36_0965 [Gammaproteobacteria bacterium]
MKLFVATLVLINIGYWMWTQWYATPPGRVPVPVARAAYHPELMPLITDPGVKLKKRARNKSARPKKLVDVTPPRLCYRIGPFTSQRTVTEARARLANVVVAAVPREDVDAQVTYRVFIPPLASGQEVKAMREKLTRLGFKDHAPITGDPELRHAISLGVFRVEANASKRMRKLKKKGIKAKRYTLHRTTAKYWLDVKSEQALSDALRDRWEVAKLQVEDVKCDAPETASKGKMGPG